MAHSPNQGSFFRFFERACSTMQSTHILRGKRQSTANLVLWEQEFTEEGGGYLII